MLTKLSRKDVERLARQERASARKCLRWAKSNELSDPTVAAKMLKRANEHTAIADALEIAAEQGSVEVMR